MDPLSFRSKDFVHLHLHSDYSLLQSAIKLKPLAGRLKEQDAKACAITDYGNMFGAVSFYQQMKYEGIRPIVGYEAYVTDGSRFDRGAAVAAGERPFYNLVLLAKDITGYQNLVYLASKAFTEGLHGKPRIDREILAEKSAGLIALSAGRAGAIRHYLRNGDLSRAEVTATTYRDIFGEDFYLEICDHGTDEQTSVANRTIELSKQLGIPLVAANDAHYLTEEDARAHEVLLCIGEGRTLSDGGRYTFPSSKYHVRSADEMWDVFGKDIPEALTNTLKIAEMCELKLPVGDNNFVLPVFPIPANSGAANAEKYFERVIAEEFEGRNESVWRPMMGAGTLRYTLDEYHQRLQREIDIIRKMGFVDYFLIVWDFIKHAKNRHIPVGPGRGSAAGSLVAYCLGITDIDPLQYDLLFERFLNPERVSMPDIDIDFCIRGRSEVIDHVSNLYGRDSVCQIITFGTMASKAAIKDVGRALNVPYADVERIAKMIPPPVRGRNVSISQALEQVPELKGAVAEDPKIKDLLDLALRLEGCSRHSSVHAAGVVISPKPLHEIVPVAMSPKNELTSQYSMNDLEKVGMLKIDFLALTTLTVIDDCLKAIKSKTGTTIEWSGIPLNDLETMAVFGEGRTDAVFQFESSGMQEICRKLKPTELEDLSALNALYRPGPIDGGMIDDYIARHRGEKKVQYLVPQMKEILHNTFGVLVYQEQIMQLAQNLAGYSLGEADTMRRAMGKKKREEMAVHEKKFISGAVANGIPEQKADEIFRLMAQFADYGFNRSHSIAYAYLAFQTAYLKAHYPAYFFAAVLSHEADDSAKVYNYSMELRSIGLNLLPPDVNESDDTFTASEEAVRFGLTAIKGMGSATISAIIDARRNGGNFTSLFDFASRPQLGSINKRALESLITSGSFDSLKPTDSETGKWRACLFAATDTVLGFAQREREDRVRGQNALFGGGASETTIEAPLPDAAAWTQSEISRQEKSSVGFYLSAHPLDHFNNVLSDMSIRNVGDYEEIVVGQTMTLAGIVSAAQIRHSKKGNRFCIFRLEDRSAAVKCLAWAEAFNKFGHNMKDDQLLVVEGRVESAGGQEITFIVSEAKLLADAIPQKARSVCIELPDAPDEEYLNDLLSILNASEGRCEVFLDLRLNGLNVRLQSHPVRVKGSYALEQALRERGCDVRWQL